MLRTGLLIASLVAPGAHHLGAATNAPFSIQQREGTSWLVKPNGERFFSLGVCVVTMGASREDFDPENPGYAAFRHYENSNRWAEATLKRLESWKFTTISGWSDYAAIKQCRDSRLAFTPVLHVGSTAGVPWWDMWDTNIIARMHQIARDQILPLRDDPRLLGYYSDNELGWWNAALFKMTLEHNPASGQRQRLIELLRETYHNDWSELLKDFEPQGTDSFEQLDQRGMLYLRPGSNGIRTYRRFLSLMATRYYSLVREILRTYDQRALVLGDRYQSFYYPEVARACLGQVDAVSGTHRQTGFGQRILHVRAAKSQRQQKRSEYIPDVSHAGGTHHRIPQHSPGAAAHPLCYRRRLVPVLRRTDSRARGRREFQLRPGGH